MFDLILITCGPAEKKSHLIFLFKYNVSATKKFFEVHFFCSVTHKCS